MNPGDYSVALAVSGGQQVGYIEIDEINEQHASLWSGTPDSWVDLSPAGTTQSFAYGIGDGQQVGYTRVGGDPVASLWSGTAASWVNLDPAGTASYAFGVSSGRQVGLVYVAGYGHASLWSGTAESWLDLHPADSRNSSAVSLSSTQQVGWVTLEDNPAPHAALWSGSAASWVDLHPVGFDESEALGVSGGFQVGYVFRQNRRHASLWNGTADSWVDLGCFLPPEFTGSTATSIWSDANVTYVAGYASNSVVGRSEAILWTRPVPEPGAAATLILSSLLGPGRRRRAC